MVPSPIMSSQPYPRRLTAALVGIVAVAAALPATAEARMSVIYEFAPGSKALVREGETDPSDGLRRPDNAVQQQPGARNNVIAGQAGKVIGRPARSDGGSPSIAGLSAQQMSAVLTAELDRPRHEDFVFIDELSKNFRDGDGSNLRAALGLLGDRARRVHVYVPGPELLVQNPEPWSDAWQALVASGGVWLEAYSKTARGRNLWQPEEWLTYSRTFSREFIRQGGDPSRLHFVMSAPEAVQRPTFNEPRSQSEQWRWARTGAACTILANGPGTWRLAGETNAAADRPSADAKAAAFLAEFRAVFGRQPAPEGTQDIASSCLPHAQPDAIRVAQVAAIIAPRSAGIRKRVTIRNPIWAGHTNRGLAVDLGRDPGGIAAFLRRKPEDFWGAASAQVTLSSPDGRVVKTLRVGADGRTKARGFRPHTAGQWRMRLAIPGRVFLNYVASQPVDLAAAMAPHADGLGPVVRVLERRPADWSLKIDLRGSPLPVRDVPNPATITSLTLRPEPAESVQELGRDPRRFEVTRLTARDSNGRIVPFARVVLRGPGKTRVRRSRTLGDGSAMFLSPRNGRRIRATAPSSGTKASRTLPTRAVTRRLVARETGIPRSERAERPPRVWRRVVVLARTRSGLPVPAQPIRARRGPERVLRAATDGRGRAVLWVRRERPGALVVRTGDGPKLRVRLELPSR